MLSLGENPSRKDVIEFLSGSSIFGNLGVFIGAGFSKAVMNNGGSEIALSWGQLLEKVSETIGVDYSSIEKKGIGYPEMATSVCAEHSDNASISYDEALSRLKREISIITNWYPSKESREEYSKYMLSLDPSWIITTNYDLIIESLLTGKGLPLGPNESLVSSKQQVPIYHLHGIRTNPEGIIISQEDYVALFRPNEYRQIKLALMVKESTTLLLGYALGDVNVLTAIDWSKNVFENKNNNYPHSVIQVYRTENPKTDPYRDRNGILIIEVASLAEFFDEYIPINLVKTEEHRQEQESLQALSERMTNPDDNFVAEFIDERAKRKAMLGELGNFSSNLLPGFISFLNHCIDETWVRAQVPKAFTAYDQNLIILLDIITAFKLETIPPDLLETCAYALNRVGYYVGLQLGKSHKAHRTFEARKKELSKEIVGELLHIAKQHSYSHLEELMRRVV